MWSKSQCIASACQFMGRFLGIINPNSSVFQVPTGYMLRWSFGFSLVWCKVTWARPQPPHGGRLGGPPWLAIRDRVQIAGRAQSTLLRPPPPPMPFIYPIPVSVSVIEKEDKGNLNSVIRNLQKLTWRRTANLRLPGWGRRSASPPSPAEPIWDSSPPPCRATDVANVRDTYVGFKYIP